MNTTTPITKQETEVSISREDIIITRERFFPSGAIAFFIALVLLCLVIWFGVYFLMLERI